MNVEESILDIDDQLRFVLFGLECVLNVEFSPAEVERLFDAAERDPSPGGEYVFWQGRGLSVTGRVDDYASYYVSLRVESRRPVAPSLAEITERAKYQVYRIERRREAEPEEA
jgi:hypothetical protein